MAKSSRPKRPNKAEMRKKMIAEANIRHDAVYGTNPEKIEYYKEYKQGTGLRQSK